MRGFAGDFILLTTVCVLCEVQPEFVDPHQTDYIAAEGERIDLDCSVRANVFPNASVVWQKREGGLLQRVGTGETLTILKAGLKDSGTYICKATNNPHKPLTIRSKHIVLTVYGKSVHYYRCCSNNYSEFLSSQFQPRAISYLLGI